ncbi:unnamed protein product [Oreochromis niloticus]|nr:unnamed protein product [Mustela putorius furo]
MKLSLILLFLQLWGCVEVSLSQNVCSELPNVPHAHVSEGTSKAVYQEGDVIHFSCESGYISDQISKFVCTTDGWLVVRQGKCYFSSSRCDPPPTVQGLTVKGLPENCIPIRPNHILTFSCDGPGKYLNGVSVLICGQDGQWNNPFPTCIDRSCKVGVMHPHLYVAGLPPSNEIMATGHKLRFLCSNTHELIGSTEIECLENGQWNSSFPTCSVERSCGRPPPVSDGDTKTSTKQQYQHNERVEYICQKCHIMVTGPFKTCVDGEWIGEIRCLLLIGCSIWSD